MEGLDPAGEEGIGVFGYIDSHFRRGFAAAAARCAAILDAGSRALRRLPRARRRDPRDARPARALGMSEEDVEAKRGIAYTASAQAALELARRRHPSGVPDAPDPVGQVRAVAAEGETMPPKSTYFFPKLLTGIVFNPLS